MAFQRDMAKDENRRKVNPQPMSFLEPPMGADEIGRLAQYRILKVLGKGGMGMVLLAEDTELQRRVALKVITSGAGPGPRYAATLSAQGAGDGPGEKRSRRHHPPGRPGREYLLHRHGIARRRAAGRMARKGGRRR